MTASIYQQLKDKNAKLAVIGLGYVGLPVALAFARKISVIGFDISEERVEMMKRKVDPSKELKSEAFENCDIEFTTSGEILAKANFFIVCVPTPVDSHNVPDLVPLLAASKTVGDVIKKGDYVVFESTTYPGCTEEECQTVIEQFSGLKCGSDFKLGYSPERINPGDEEHTIDRIIKVVSGCDEDALNEIALVYKLICLGGVHRAPSIKVAEAAKIIENTQRDVNIALMNELSRIFQKLGINTYDVLEAAATKWNFLKFTPGLVGGHCISVDPYYLTYKAHELGYEAEVITSGRRLNDDMGPYIAKKTVQLLLQHGKDLSKARVLVMGATFKENVADIRNSKVIDVINELKQFSLTVDVVDPFASGEEMMHEYRVPMAEKVVGKYDAVVLAVAHRQYLTLDEDYFLSITSPGAVFTDVKGVFRKKIKKMNYWSL
jgi:UDP-N-acetyl-D-galactosamine dehydrogenase